ncbi:MAG: DNA repair protein RadA [bacterium]|nr:DNA repair protein RadA [bacterium]
MASKTKSRISYVCQECGYDSPEWLGKCPECGSWNSLKEIRLGPSVSFSGGTAAAKPALPKKLRDISVSSSSRFPSGFSEMDTVLGGGIVQGGVILLAGDPGVGKSTLLLQLCLLLGKKQEVLYISGEESVEQVKMRATRLLSGKKVANVLENVLLLSLTDSDQAVAAIADVKPSLVILDSIQTMQSVNVAGLSGSIPQVRYGALQLVRLAKELGVPIIIVGHVTKEGMVAGPMVLSHMVDTVLFLEGEKFSRIRLLRSLKNRFGPVDEVGVFSMEEGGMEQVSDPSQLFLTDHKTDVPGSVLVVTMEGSRAFLVELQALAVSSRLPMPRRVASGIDPRRLELLLAVLQKHCRLPVDTADIFVNVAGGMKLSDPAVDLAVCLAVYSSMKNVPLPRTVGIAEVGLLGELRRVSGVEKRIKQSKQFGFTRIISHLTHATLPQVLESLESRK